MKLLTTCIVAMSILISGNVLADKGGNGGADFGSTTGGAMPPGLQNKGLPHGLNMPGKTPAGWSHGNKRGWTKSHHKHGNKHNTITNIAPTVTTD